MKKGQDNRVDLPTIGPDTINNLVAKGHYAEVYRNTLTKNDSMFITKKALVITKTENDILTNEMPIIHQAIIDRNMNGEPVFVNIVKMC